MNFEILESLSNADSIASHEDEVRQIIKNYLRMYEDTFQYDGLGSLIITKKSKTANSPTLLFAAHMDEVGYMIRSISDIGMAYLTKVGGVERRSEEMQIVRATTETGEKIEGILNIVNESDGPQAYVDFGFESKEEFFSAGLNIGDIVCFSSNYRELEATDIICGKAFDDRIGCFSLIQAMMVLANVDLSVNVVAAFTSSEEVGTRGGRLVASKIKPDLFFAIDVAKHPELDRGFKNHRKLGKGPMIEFYDKTMIPNPRLLRFIRSIADAKGLNYQRDMFKGGGTDAGTAHLENNGIISAVLGLPLRYCHDSYSLANKNDLRTMSALITGIAKNMNKETIAEFYHF